MLFRSEAGYAAAGNTGRGGAGLSRRSPVSALSQPEAYQEAAALDDEEVHGDLAQAPPFVGARRELLGGRLGHSVQQLLPLFPRRLEDHSDRLADPRGSVRWLIHDL